MPNSAKQAPVTRPTYPVPTMAMFIVCLRPGGSSAAGAILKVPLDEAGDPLLDRTGGRVPDPDPGARNVRPCGVHVAGLRRQALDPRGFSEGARDHGDQIRKGRGLRLAEVQDRVALDSFRGGLDAVHDVVDPRVVPAGASVPVLGNLLSLVDQARELVDRHLRALARPVDRE